MDCLSPDCEGIVRDFRCNTCELEQVVTEAGEVRVPGHVLVVLVGGEELRGVVAETVDRSSLRLTTEDREELHVGFDRIEHVGPPSS